MEKMKTYSFSIGNIPLPRVTNLKEIGRILDSIKSLDGFIALSPAPVNAGIVILMFDTYNNAVGARNELKFEGIQCGINIMECEISDDFKDVLIKGIAKRS